MIAVSLESITPRKYAITLSVEKVGILPISLSKNILGLLTLKPYCPKERIGTITPYLGSSI